MTCADAKVGINYGDGYYSTFKTTNSSECCTACSMAAYCRAWDWATDSHDCWLKNNDHGSKVQDNRMSGLNQLAPRNDSAAFWLQKRKQILETIWDGKLPPASRSVPDYIFPTNHTDVTRLVWDITARTPFGASHPMNATAYHKFAVGGQRTRKLVINQHGARE